MRQLVAAWESRPAGTGVITVNGNLVEELHVKEVRLMHCIGLCARYQLNGSHFLISSGWCRPKRIWSPSSVSTTGSEERERKCRWHRHSILWFPIDLLFILWQHPSVPTSIQSIQTQPTRRWHGALRHSLLQLLFFSIRPTRLSLHLLMSLLPRQDCNLRPGCWALSFFLWHAYSMIIRSAGWDAGLLFCFVFLLSVSLHVPSLSWSLVNIRPQTK